MERMTTSADPGFTLLETVVVVAVIAILSITATFAVTTRKAGEGDRARFAATYDSLRDAAILGRSPQALALLPNGWQILLPERAENGGTVWQQSGKPQKFSAEARFEGEDGAIVPHDLSRAPEPDLIFLPDGQVTPFEVAFIGNGTLTRCRSAGFAGLICEGP